MLTWKVVTQLLAIAAAVVWAMDPTVKVAIIVAIPPTISAITGAWINHRKLDTIEVNTNHRLDELLGERNLATTRADFAEGKIEGAAAEKKDDPRTL